MSIILLLAITFSAVKIVTALQANPGHDISTLGGAAIGAILYGSATDIVSALADVAVGRVLISGGAGVAPLYSTTPTLGAVGTLGTLSLAGNTSGVITLQPQAAAGTYNFNLPTGAGTAGQPLLSGGGVGAAMTFGTLGVAAGGTGLTATADDAVFVGDSVSAVTARVLPTCSGATTDKLLYNISTNTFSCGVDQTGGGSSYRTLIVNAVDDASTAATTFQNITELSFAVTAGTTYRWQATILYTTSAATIGIRIAPSGPAFTQNAYLTWTGISTTGSASSGWHNSQTTLAAGTVSSASISTTGGNLIMATGVYKPSSSGTFQLQFAPETATANGVIIQDGSTLEWW